MGRTRRVPFFLTVPAQADELSIEQSEAPAIAKSRLSVRQLRNHKFELIGDPGLPLGTVAELTAVIVSAEELRPVTKGGGEGHYLLSVTHVDQRALKTPVVIEFSPHRMTEPPLVNNAFALHEFKKGRKTGQLNSVQIKELESGYVNRTVNIVAYESGEFRGMPRNLPKGMGIWQDMSYHFENSLVVLSLRERDTAKTRAVPRAQTPVEQSTAPSSGD